MNDIEKAIDNLNFIKHNDFNDNIKQYKRIGVNSIDLAISALEKQIEIKEYLKQLDENHKDFTKTMTIYEVESDVLDFVIEEEVNE